MKNKALIYQALIIYKTHSFRTHTASWAMWGSHIIPIWQIEKWRHKKLKQLVYSDRWSHTRNPDDQFQSLYSSFIICFHACIRMHFSDVSSPHVLFELKRKHITSLSVLFILRLTRVSQGCLVCSPDPVIYVFINIMCY